VLRECKSFSICCSSVGFHATRIISSAKRRLLMYISLVIFTPYSLSSHSGFSKMDCKHDINSLGDMVSPCLTPLFMGKLSPSTWSLIVYVEQEYMFRSVLMYFGCIFCSLSAFKTAGISTESKAFSKSMKASEMGIWNSTDFSLNWLTLGGGLLCCDLIEIPPDLLIVRGLWLYWFFLWEFL